jgi:hypothetical protein
LKNDKHPSYMKYKTSPLPHFERGLTQRNWPIIPQCKWGDWLKEEFQLTHKALLLLKQKHSKLYPVQKEQ